MREKITLEVKYKKGAMRINKDSLPLLRHIPREFLVERAEILKAGSVLVNGEPREFQEIRIYLKPCEWMGNG